MKLKNQKHFNEVFTKMVDEGQMFCYGDGAPKNNTEFVSRMEKNFQEKIKKIDEARKNLIDSRENKIKNLHFETILVEALGGQVDYSNPLFFDGELITESRTGCDSAVLSRLQSENITLRKENRELKKIVMRGKSRYVDPKHKKELRRANAFRKEMIHYFKEQRILFVDKKGNFVELKEHVAPFED